MLHSLTVDNPVVWQSTLFFMLQAMLVDLVPARQNSDDRCVEEYAGMLIGGDLNKERTLSDQNPLETVNT